MPLIGAFAEATDQDLQLLFADFEDPEANLAQLARLETEAVAPFMAKMAAAVRAQDPHGIIARQYTYFANLGVPSGQPPLSDEAWAYSPHGYGLTVGTPAIVLSSDTRAGTISARRKETQDRLGVPAIAGEWGALTLGEGISPTPGSSWTPSMPTAGP